MLPALLCSLAGLDEPWAWELREMGLAAGHFAELGKSLCEVTGEKADALRERLAGHDRLAALKSLTGVDSPFARKLRERLFEKAPKAVLRSLQGVDAEYANELRERAAPFTKEALDSIDGLDTPQAWSLRVRFASLWPSTALSSLEQHALSPRGLELIDRVLAKNPGKISVLKNAYGAIRRAQALQSGFEPREAIERSAPVEREQAAV